MEQTLFYKGLHLYNNLPDDLKTKNPKLLSRHLKKYIINYYPCDKIDSYDPGWYILSQK